MTSQRGGGKAGERVSVHPDILMPVVIKFCFVAEDKSSPAVKRDFALLPPGTPWGVANADKPLEKNEAVIRSCPTGTNAASVTGAVILTVCPAASAEFPIHP